MVKIGVIGGTGIDSPDILSDLQKKEVVTPFGSPASELTTGKIDGVEVVLISRHGPAHKFNPTHVPYRANIWALKQEGCTHILAPSAVGSLQEHIKPGDLVFTDQIIDRTTKRDQTFYDTSHLENSTFDKVCHITVAEPTSRYLRDLAKQSADILNLEFHDKGAIVVIEGPRFSTKAESNLFRSWNADIIGMTAVPEAFLAREAEIPYVQIAMVTDYDVWKDSHVTLDEVMATMASNVEKVKKLLLDLIPKIKDDEQPEHTALRGALI